MIAVSKAALGRVGLFIALCAAGVCHAQDRQMIKDVTVELVTKVNVTEFAAQIEVRRKDAAALDYSTPERAAESQFNHMAAGDFAAWLEGWSPESRELMQKRYRETGAKPEDVARNWAGTLQARRIFLLGKAEYFRESVGYVLVRYRASSRPQAQVPAPDDFSNILSFKRVGGRWMQVQDLASDPVFLESSRLWDFTTNKLVIRRPNN